MLRDAVARREPGGSMSSDDLIAVLVERVGGVQNLQDLLSDGIMSGHVGDSGGAAVPRDENTEGYCYLRLFDSIDQRDAIALGSYPTVADLRRFSNSRCDPFGTRMVVASVVRGFNGRVAHIQYNSGTKGLRPIEALSALSKDVRVGGLPDGASEVFPPQWIPAMRIVYQCWDFIPGNGRRNLNILDWLGPDPLPTKESRLYEPISSPNSRVRWTIKASPVGPDTARVDIIDKNGAVRSVKQWESLVAPWGHYQDTTVRGDRIFLEAEVWRPALVTTTPGAPAPTPPVTGGDREELFARRSRVQTHVVTGGFGLAAGGLCYVNAFRHEYKARVSELGSCPTAETLLAFITANHVADGVFSGELCADNLALVKVSPGLYHVEEGKLNGPQFIASLSKLSPGDRVGATQNDAVRPNQFENIALPASLSLRPSGVGMIISIPFAVKLTMEKPQMFWNLTGGKKLSSLTSYFESVELVSLKLKATVHKGDADTLLCVAADASNSVFRDEMDWVAASHTLHVSGNVNGATTGELVLEGNHGFGTQLKGLSVGNAPPNIQAFMETAVVANALIKVVLTVRVNGTGNPTAIILPAREGAVSRGVSGDVDSEEEEEMPVASNCAKGKR